VQSNHAWCALYEIDSMLRNLLKHGDDRYETVGELAMAIRTKAIQALDKIEEQHMKIKITFVFTKGDGWIPDYSLLPKNKRTTKYIKSFMKFCPAFEDAENEIKSWKIVDDGLDQMKFKDGIFDGTPTPIIEFVLNKKVDKEEFLHKVWTSSYKLEIPDVNNDDAYFYEDHNGYSYVVS
jgi:hypothetical protein